MDVKTKQVMHPDHPGWANFTTMLGKRIEEVGCAAERNKHSAIGLLKKHFPKLDVDDTVKVLEWFGGYCDCEILMNVPHQWRHSKPESVERLQKDAAHTASNLLEAVKAGEFVVMERLLHTLRSLAGNLSHVYETLTLKQFLLHDE